MDFYVRCMARTRKKVCASHCFTFAQKQEALSPWIIQLLLSLYPLVITIMLIRTFTCTVLAALVGSSAAQVPAVEVSERRVDAASQ